MPIFRRQGKPSEEDPPGEAYGFMVTVGGVGSSWLNIGDNGEAFDGCEDNEDVQVIDVLLATDSMSHDGLLYDADGSGVIDNLEATLRALANEVYSAINEQGDI